MFLYYALKEFIKCLRCHKKSESALYKGFVMYKNTKKKDRKCLLNVVHELNQLSRYWHAFPDSYFRFGMFMKNWGDFGRMKSFVPQEAYSHFAMDKDSRYHVLIDDKILFHDLMTRYGLPVPTRFFTFRNGEFRSGSIFLTDKEVDIIISNIVDDRIFVKRFTGGGASGVSILIKKMDGVYVDKENDVVSAQMIRNKYADQDVFFEKQIKQERVLSQFNPDTVNTIRVLTYKNKIISAVVRFGGKGDFVDNVSKGGVAVGCDIETGVLSTYGMRMYDIKKYYSHPVSLLKFEGVIVTQWPEVRALIELTLHYLPYYNSVGFDIATTDDGPIILEINTGAGINLSQTGKYGLENFFLNNNEKKC